MIYLDNSATTWPKPAQVRAAAAGGFRTWGRTRGEEATPPAPKRPGRCTSAGRRPRPCWGPGGRST